MNAKRTLRKAILLIMAAALLSLLGCGLPDTQRTASGSALDSVRGVLSRTHHEFYDTDGLFVTYWERYFDRGSAIIAVSSKAYSTSIDYKNVATASGEKVPCIVAGKGIKPCRGEEISWTTPTPPEADYFGVYGWLRDPLVEYYIGRPGGTKMGTYKTSRGTYTLYIDYKNQENIIHSEPPGSKFLQFNCDGPATGTINMSEHYDGWQDVLDQLRWNADPGWDWHHIETPDYCVVATEVWSKRSGKSYVTNINIDHGMHVTPSYLRVHAKGSSTGTSAPYFRVRSSTNWYILSNTIPNWVTVSKTKGGGGLTLVNVEVARNTTGRYRRANLAFSITGTNSTYAFFPIVQSASNR